MITVLYLVLYGLFLMFYLLIPVWNLRPIASSRWWRSSEIDLWLVVASDGSLRNGWNTAYR